MDSENCPVGLEYLLHVDQLFIKQQTEIMEVFSGIETANKYQVRLDLSEIISLKYGRPQLSQTLWQLTDSKRFWMKKMNKFSLQLKCVAVYVEPVHGNSVDRFAILKWSSQVSDSPLKHDNNSSQCLDKNTHIIWVGIPG